MFDLREEERLTLARELHAELAPCLFGIKMRFAAVNKFANVQARPEIGRRLPRSTARRRSSNA